MQQALGKFIGNFTSFQSREGKTQFPHCYIPTANQKPLPSDIKEKPVLLKFETHAQCLSLQLHITLLNELNAMGNVA